VREERGERRACGKEGLLLFIYFSLSLSLSLLQGIDRVPRLYGYVQNTLEETVERHRARTGKDAARGTEDAVWEEGEGGKEEGEKVDKKE
jgi:hypothetical protein